MILQRISQFVTSGLLAIVCLLATTNSFAAGGVVKDPNGVAPARYVYYPGTEELAKDEIRLFACGTGLPAARLAEAANEAVKKGLLRCEDDATWKPTEFGRRFLNDLQAEFLRN